MARAGWRCAVDTWWEAEHPEQRISQTIRCYTPADLALLTAGTGLVLDRITVGGHTIEIAPQAGFAALLRDHHEYLAVLRHG